MTWEILSFRRNSQAKVCENLPVDSNFFLLCSNFSPSYFLQSLPQHFEEDSVRILMTHPAPSQPCIEALLRVSDEPWPSIARFFVSGCSVVVKKASPRPVRLAKVLDTCDPASARVSAVCLNRLCIKLYSQVVSLFPDFQPVSFRLLLVAASLLEFVLQTLQCSFCTVVQSSGQSQSVSDSTKFFFGFVKSFVNFQCDDCCKVQTMVGMLRRAGQVGLSALLL